MEKQKKFSQSGITLVALVITIILLLILAGISISQLSGSGLFENAKLAEERSKNAQEQENGILSNYEEWMENYLDKETESPLVTTLTSIQKKTVYAVDRLGNPITIPAGFRYVTGDIVQNGIVIEDNNITTYSDGKKMGNQFVWVPVSNIDGDETSSDSKLTKIETKDEVTGEITISEVEITLGRYDTFTTTAEPIQLGSDYESGAEGTYKIGSYYYKELNTAENPEGVASVSNLGKNAIYQTLGAFITSVKENYGYYIARYEASYESGSTLGDETTPIDYKMASKMSKNKNASKIDYTTELPIWNFITQLNASKVCRNMYNESDFVVDLVNSYMWDTAIIFITKVSDSSYESTGRGNNTSLLNTGETADIKCNIYDMAGNLREWTTEYSSKYYEGYNSPCTVRGGVYNMAIFTKTRGEWNTNAQEAYIGFRAGIYIL